MAKDIPGLALQNIYFDVPEKILDQFYIVLVNPKHPKNVGACARAMLNMGFHNLIITGSQDVFNKDAYALARSAEPVLDAATFVPTLEEALADIRHVVGTSRRPVRYEYEIKTPDQIIPSLFLEARANKIAILFGPEDTGLQIEHLSLCNQLLRIPTSTEYPSLNLSLAVAITCYEIFKNVINYPLPKGEVREKASTIVMEGLFKHLEEFFNEIDYFPYEETRHTMQLYRQMYRNCNLNDYDVGLLRSILHKTQKYVKLNKERSEGP